VITCRGPTITLALNGSQTVEYRETDPTAPRQGIIALQLVRTRNIRETKVEFKDIWIKELE
jgi:hypothetical protein